MIIAEEILRRSHFCDFPFFASLCKVVMVSCCGMAALKLGLDFFQKRLSVKKLILIAAGFLYIAFLILRGQSDAFMVMWLFAATLHDVDFERIVKVSALSAFSAVAVVTVGYAIGIIDTTVIEIGERIRNGMGFMEVFQAAYFLFFATLSWFYHRKEKLSWYEMITLAALGFVVFRLSDTKGPFLMTALLLAVAVILKLFPVLRKYQALYTWIALLAPVICAGLIIVQGTYISPNVSEFLRELNSKLSTRLMLNYQGVQQFGFSFWGKPIEWYDDYNGHMYNWVDSVYLYSLLSYGVPFMLGFFAVTTKLALAAGKKKDTYMVVALVLIAILGMVDNYCFRIECNPFYLFFAYEASVNSVEQSSGERKNEIHKKCA